MKLRTGKKQKNTEYDNGSDGQQEQTAKKGSGTKNHSEKETHSSNEVLKIKLNFFRIQMIRTKMNQKIDTNSATQ